MTFEQENDFLNKYINKYVIVSTNERRVYGSLYGLERACDSDSGNTEIDIKPVEKDYVIGLDDTEIVSIEIVNKEDCIGKDEEPLDI